MATYEDKWFEIWYSDGEDVVPTYLLIVTPNPHANGQILVLDPQLNNKIVFEAKDYEDAFYWLREDEYTVVDGRQFPDDGWPLPTYSKT